MVLQTPPVTSPIVAETWRSCSVGTVLPVSPEVQERQVSATSAEASVSLLAPP